GKTRLLQEAARRAPGHGWRVLQGGCQRRGGQEPYAPLLGTLKRHIQGQAPVHLRTDLRGCAWLVRLLPELAEGPIEPLPGWTLAPEHERRLMFKAVARFLANVAGPAGTPLGLDDLQWAGADALAPLATPGRPAGPGAPAAGRGCTATMQRPARRPYPGTWSRASGRGSRHCPRWRRTCSASRRWSAASCRQAW